MSTPRQDYYLDELKAGDRFESVGFTFTESAIIDFAFAYDPQPFHIDVDAASKSNYGGLIASGFQTLAVAFRLLYQTGFLKSASLGGPGMDELRWLKPVYAGDTLRSVGEVREIVPSKSKPDRGILKLHLTAINQKDEAVMTVTMIILVKRSRNA